MPSTPDTAANPFLIGCLTLSFDNYFQKKSSMVSIHLDKLAKQIVWIWPWGERGKRDIIIFYLEKI